MSAWTVSLEFADAASSKFWRARVDGATLYVSFGKLGTAGQTQVKDCGDAAGAQREYERLVREKRRKGYVDAGEAAAAGGPSRAGSASRRRSATEPADPASRGSGGAEDDPDGGDDVGDDDDDGDDDADADAGDRAATGGPRAAAGARRGAGGGRRGRGAAGAPGPGQPPDHRMVLEVGGRAVEARLYRDGATVRMEAVEDHGSPEAAQRAIERLQRALAGDGYREV